jgi:hypothetical protein
MKEKSIILIMICLFCASCQTISSQQDEYKEIRQNVGDISFDPSCDNPDFVVCNDTIVLPYNTRCGMMIEGERYKVLEYFNEEYNLRAIKGQTGYITIRFLVNCKGETDRFRLYEMDNDLKEFTFDKLISTTLLDLTKKLTGWEVQLPYKLVHTGGLRVSYVSEHPEVYDYYQYIVFKLKDGLIETILP